MKKPIIKCEAIKEFSLEKFDKLKNVKRRNKDIYKRLFIGDTFGCDEQMAKYLLGNNSKNKIVVKIIEVLQK